MIISEFSYHDYTAKYFYEQTMAYSVLKCKLMFKTSKNDHRSGGAVKEGCPYLSVLTAQLEESKVCRLLLIEYPW